MRRRFLDAIAAAGREGRSVALATELKAGRQLLLDRDRFDGDLELDESAQQAFAVAAANYFLKPYSARDLLDIVAHYCRDNPSDA